MGVVGAAIKGFGKALKVGKKAKLTTVYRPKKGIYIKQFKKSKKQGLKDKFDVWTNRQAAVAIEQAGHGVNIKYTKKGKPYVPKGTKPSMLTKAKGFVKLTSPITVGLTAGAVHGKIKGKK